MKARPGNPYSASYAVAAVAIGLTLAASPVLAQGPAAPVATREYRIKAAYLYQFSQYVGWPEKAFASKTSPFVIGIYGTNPFADAAKTIAKKKKVGKRPIEFRVLKSPSAATKCHIVFVPSRVTPENLKKLLVLKKNKSILVVGESGGFIDSGGDVQFFLMENKVRFAINQKAVKAAGLPVSSKLLTLAKPAPPHFRRSEPPRR